MASVPGVLVFSELNAAYCVDEVTKSVFCARQNRKCSVGEESRRALPPGPELGTPARPHTTRRGAPHANCRLPPLEGETQGLGGQCLVLGKEQSAAPF